MNQTYSPNGNGATPALMPPSMLPPVQQQTQGEATVNFERGNGEQVLSPVTPQQSSGVPAWPVYQPPQQPAYQPQQAPQQPQFQQPAYQPAPAYQPPVYQQPPAWQPPQQPQAPAYSGQQLMPQDPALQQRQGYQFQDQLRLAGQSGGGVVQPQIPAQPVAPFQGSPALAGAQSTFAYQPQQQAQQPPQNLLLQQLAARGLPVSQYGNDQQFLEEMGQGYQELQQFRAQQRFNGAPGGFSNGEDLTAQTPGLANGQAAQAVTTGAPPSKRTAPEWRAEWSSLVTQDDATGMFKAVDPSVVPPAIVQRANEYAAWKRERGEQLLRDPMALIREEGLEQYLAEQKNAWKQEIVAEFKQQEVQQQSQAAVESFVNKHKASLFQLDAQGQPARDYRGEYIRTPLGEQLNQQAAQLRQQFVSYYGREPDPRHIMAELDQRLAGIAPPQQQAPPANQAQPPAYQPYQPQQFQPAPQFQQPAPAYFQQPPPAQMPLLPNRNEQLKDNLIQRQLNMRGEAYAPNQLGTVASAAASPTVPQNARLSFLQMCQQDAISKGIMHPEQVY